MNPLSPASNSSGLPTSQQTVDGDGNQTIGQVLGGMVIYVSGGQAIINTGQGDRDTATKPDAKTIGPNPYNCRFAYFRELKRINDMTVKE